METAKLNCFNDLQHELDDAKNTLIILNDNIRRIIGRSPKDLRNEKHRTPQEAKRNDNRQAQKINDTSKFKRRNYDSKSVFNRLSGPTSRSGDEESRPRLNSRVIRELPTRQEIVAAQCTDSESRARNRRMFGSLLGTLHKFCQEESRLKQKEDKKAQIEKKVEEQELQERETLKRERELLFMDRKRKQLEIRTLELKMNRLKDFEMWKVSTSTLKHFIKTKSKPHIYFKPRIFSKTTEMLLLHNQTDIEIFVGEKRDNINKELSEIEKNLKAYESESEDHLENITNNGNSVAEQCTVYEKIKDEFPHYKDKNPGNLELTRKIGELDAKENKSKNDNGTTVSSSVVVIKNL